MTTPGSQKWHRQQVKTFNDDRGNHEAVAGVLELVLKEIKRRTDPSAMVQVRPKTLASFSEKAIRKKNKYSDPVTQLTDVVGGRIITYTQTAAEKVCRLIEQLDRLDELEIDWDNTSNTTERLKPEEFGYKAMHYIVQMKPPKILGVYVESRFSPYKVEIQVCTMLQHVWSAIGHDRVYKTRLKIPDSLKRRLSAISALIETAQAEFDNGIVALDQYIEQFLPHVSHDSREEEEMKWESVLYVEPYNQVAHHKLGDHWASLDQWEKAYQEYAKSDRDVPGVLAKLGRAAARIGKTEESEALLSEAVQKDKGDWAARCDLAELLEERGDPDKALEQCEQAFEAAPGEPRVLVSYVTAILCREGHLSCTQALRGALDGAIEESKNRAELGVDLPDAYFQIGRCYLFRRDLYAALDAYCKASLKCASLSQIEAERLRLEAITEALSKDGRAAGRLEHFECARRLLCLLGVAVGRRLRQPLNADGRPQTASLSPGEKPQGMEETDRLEELATKDGRPSFSKRPVVIVAGGCEQSVEERMQLYRDTLGGAFADFEGTVICGGTKAGISGLIGQVARQRGDAICAVGYLPPPAQMPQGDHRDEENYQQICDVDFGHGGYSPIGPIQTWADLLLAGVEPSRVRLLGINGGHLSGFEFRLAMAMGASVGLIEDSGRAVSDLLSALHWRELGRLAPLFNEAETLIPFVAAFCPNFQAIPDPAEREEKLEKMARAKHEEYRTGKLASKGYVHESMLPWEKGLDVRYQESNRQQAAYADRILRTEGFAIVSENEHRPAVHFNDPEFTDPEGQGYEALWRMAQREHGRFNAERLADGWRYGPVRDLEAKTSPYLVPWDKLSREVQAWDRDPFLKLSELLASLGLKIVRIS